MKRLLSVPFISLLFILLCIPGLLRSELLSKIGPVDTAALETLKGFWIMEDSKYMFEFTTSFACFVDGVKYFHYKRSSDHTSHPWVYTIVKSKKTGNYYFARGSYVNGRFTGTTSRLVIDDKNNITVYSSNDPKKVFFYARRVQPDKIKPKPENDAKKS